MAILFSIMAFVFIIISIVQDSGCNFMEVMLTSKSPSGELEKLNMTIDPLFKQMIDASLAEGSSASLESILPDIDISKVD